MVRRNMGMHGGIPSDPTNFRHEVPVEFPNGAFQHSEHINESRHQADLRPGARGTLGLPPLFGHTSRPPRRWPTTSDGEGGHP
jgi:hypothetical protein